MFSFNIFASEFLTRVQSAHTLNDRWQKSNRCWHRWLHASTEQTVYLLVTGSGFTRKINSNKNTSGHLKSKYQQNLKWSKVVLPSMRLHNTGTTGGNGNPSINIAQNETFLKSNIVWQHQSPVIPFNYTLLHFYLY